MNSIHVGPGKAMSATILFIVLLSFRHLSYAQPGKVAADPGTYDSSLAKRLGADDYGMKKYVLAFLKSGPVHLHDSTQRAEIQRAHLKNILRLAADRTLIVAGPFLDNEAIRGIFIFNVETVEEARTIAETDPAVKAGVLTLELHPWYGSAALVETPRIHKRIEKKSVAD